MKLNTKQKKFVEIAGIIWKIVSSIALIILFSITTSLNYAESNANDKLVIELHSKDLINLQTTSKEQKEDIKNINSILNEQIKITARIDKYLEYQQQSIHKFWETDWKNLESRLVRIEEKLDKRR